MNPLNVFRDELSVWRGEYHVMYQPADSRLSFATIQLVFHQLKPDTAVVAKAMEAELAHWLKRFAVPAMVSAFDPTDNLVRLSGESSNCHLMGFLDPASGEINSKWGLLGEDQLPSEQKDIGYQQHVYQGIPFRLQAEVQQKVMQDARARGRALRLSIFLVVAVPLLIEIISLGVSWLGWVLSAISIAAGFNKAAKAFGWRKPSARDEKIAEKDRKMRHYYDHCERNPEGFTRLKVENFEREAMEGTVKRAEKLRTKLETSNLAQTNPSVNAPAAQ